MPSMKILSYALPLVIPLFFLKFSSRLLLMVTSTCTILLALTTQPCSSNSAYSLNLLSTDPLAFWLSLILFLSFLLIFSSIMQKDECLTAWKVLPSLMLLLATVFTLKKILEFYIIFELITLLMAFLILAGGYQPERVSASLTMFFYTFSAILPLLVVICLTLKQSLQVDFFSLMCSATSPTITSSLLLGATSLGLMVKLPLLGFHVWLPKAHVEAPAQGSMLLAAILLKLAGLGMFRLIPTQSFYSQSWLVILSLALWSMVVIPILCATLTDTKMIIAYSSISHMAISLGCFLTFTELGVFSTILAMVTHAFSSAGMFYTASLVYHQTKSRSLLLAKSTLSTSRILSIAWILMILANLGTPPFPSLFTEISCFIVLSAFTKVMIIPISVYLWVSCVFSASLIVSHCHAQNDWQAKNSLKLEPSHFFILGLLMFVNIFSLAGLGKFHLV